MKKNIIELYCENLIFTLIQIIINFKNTTIDEVNLKFYNLVSMVLSMISVIWVKYL